jgi:hypothetical protein
VICARPLADGKLGVPKLTQDGVIVTPVTEAVGGEFTYAPYTGAQWDVIQP